MGSSKRHYERSRNRGERKAVSRPPIESNWTRTQVYTNTTRLRSNLILNTQEYIKIVHTRSITLQVLFTIKRNRVLLLNTVTLAVLSCLSIAPTSPRSAILSLLIHATIVRRWRPRHYYQREYRGGARRRYLWHRIQYTECVP
jgi:hypothetical protein